MIGRHLRITMVFFGLATLSGCIEQSLVVKVNQDQSGVIHIRHYAEQPTLLFGGTKSQSKRPIPTRERTDAVAKELGPGVTVKSISEGTNSSGWKGYEVVFECDDINQLTLNTGSLLKLHSSTKKERQDEGKDEGSDDLMSPFDEISFRFDGAELQILRPRRKTGADSSAPTTDPFADSEPVPSVNPFGNAIAQELVKRIRMGVFVQVEGTLGETNARHRRDGLISLMSLDGSKIRPKELEKLIGLKARHPKFREQAEELADESLGIEIDMQDRIVAKVH